MLLLAATAGALALAGARDLATLVVALETASLPAVGLVALRRDAQGAQAAYTLLLTAIGSLGLLLLGVALLYLATGSLHLDRIAAAVADPALDALGADSRRCWAPCWRSAGLRSSCPPCRSTSGRRTPTPAPRCRSRRSWRWSRRRLGWSRWCVLLAVGVPALAATWAPVLGVIARADA